MNEYIIAYAIIGVVHFLICYGITYREIVKFNKTSFRRKARIVWGELIFLKGVLWPLGLVMDVIKIISTIGV